MLIVVNYFGILHLLNMLVILQATWHRRFLRIAAAAAFFELFLLLKTVFLVPKEISQGNALVSFVIMCIFKAFFLLFCQTPEVHGLLISLLMIQC